MGDNFWDATIEAFDGYITKPKLEEKYLKRPPFLFILHIYIETMKASKGFGRALFTEDELSRAYYDPSKSPDVPRNEIGKRKVMFFKKLIVLISKVLKEPKAANPKMIVVGKESDKTNKFLQSLAKAAKSGIDSKPIAEKIVEAISSKAGDSKKPEAQREKSPEQRREPSAEKQTPKKRSEPENDPSSRFQRGVEDQINKEANVKKNQKKEAEGGLKMRNLRRKGEKKKTGLTRERQRRRTDEEVEKGVQKATTIEGLKSIIQKATQSTNPLGKIIEFVDDDIESMSKEYQNWHRVYVNSKSKLEEQEKLIDEQLQTYKDKITVKEEQIREKKGQIQSLKTQILRNNEKIQKLLQGIVGD